MKKETGFSRQKYKIFIVDDHPIVRKGLSQLINQESDLVVSGEAPDAQSALELLKKLKPDLAIVDISLQGIDGIELTKTIRARYGNLPVLVARCTNSLACCRTLRAGARGYIMKQEAIEKMMEAIRRVIRGDLYVSERLAHCKKFIDGKPESASSPKNFSDRETGSISTGGSGLWTRQIAYQLHKRHDGRDLPQT